MAGMVAIVVDRMAPDHGPEGGDEGGEVIATGTPDDVAEVDESSTGQYLRGVLAERAAAAA